MWTVKTDQIIINLKRLFLPRRNPISNTSLISTCRFRVIKRYGGIGRKVYSVLEPTGPSSHNLSWSPWHEATRSIATLLWMRYLSIARLPSRISSGFPDNLTVPIYTPGWSEVQWKFSALLKNTTHRPGQVSNADFLSPQSSGNHKPIASPSQSMTR